VGIAELQNHTKNSQTTRTGIGKASMAVCLRSKNRTKMVITKFIQNTEALQIPNI
jgi:hypothetical protein